MRLETFQDAAAIVTLIGYTGFVVHLNRQDDRTETEIAVQKKILKSQGFVFGRKERRTVFDAARRERIAVAEQAIQLSRP